MRKIRDVLRYRHSTDLSLETIARALMATQTHPLVATSNSPTLTAV